MKIATETNSRITICWHTASNADHHHSPGKIYIVSPSSDNIYSHYEHFDTTNPTYVPCAVMLNTHYFQSHGFHYHAAIRLASRGLSHNISRFLFSSHFVTANFLYPRSIYNISARAFFRPRANTSAQSLPQRFI